MKKAIALLLLCASCATSAPLEGEETNVPSAVKRSFDKTFPRAEHVAWVKEGAEYEASFRQQKTSYSATFNAAGTLQATEKAILDYALPNRALDYLRKNYAGATIDEAAEITLADGTTNYEAEVKGVDVMFDDRGGFLKVVKKHGGQ